MALAAIVGLAAGEVALDSTARAAVNIFTSRALWVASLPPGPQFVEDFSSFAVDTPFHSAGVALNGGTISREGPEQGLSNFIDVPPFMFGGGSGTNQGEVFVNAIEGGTVGTNIRLTFAQNNLAFGFDAWEAVGLEGARLDVYNGAVQLGSPQLPGGNGAFLGYILTGGDTATSVLFRSNSLIVGTSGEGFAIDNLTGVAVPEPGTIALVLLGAVGFVRLRSFRPVEGPDRELDLCTAPAGRRMPAKLLGEHRICLRGRGFESYRWL